MSFFQKPTVKILIHLFSSVVIGLLITIIFFYVYLPTKTNHGETITVPNVIGTHFDDLSDVLIKRNLRFEITQDSSYSPDHAPLEVLKQFPLPDSKVKENRKIYLTLNTRMPPLVKMPDLIDGSIKNAQIVLKSYDLKIGNIRYIPDEIFNTVLRQQLEGRDVLPNEMIPKGSVIDIVSGDGLGIVSLQSPNLIGLDEESASVAIIGSGLSIGEILYEDENTHVSYVTDDDGNVETITEEVAPGAVFKQSPLAGKTVRLKDRIDLWVYQPDSINTRPTLLDE